MKNRHLRRTRFTQSEGRLSPLDRLAESFALERDDSNWERIRQMRAAYFADVGALLKSGTVNQGETADEHRFTQMDTRRATVLRLGFATAALLRNLRPSVFICG